MIAARPGILLLFGLVMSTVPAPWQSSRSQPPPPAAGQAAPAPVPPSSGPVRVTTDTPEYCWSLARRVDRERLARQPPAAAPGSPDAAPATTALAEAVSLLSLEGQRMCDQGLVVGGIARLRRAWTLLHPGD
jgi:hypothetical protein